MFIKLKELMRKAQLLYLIMVENYYLKQLWQIMMIVNCQQEKLSSEQFEYIAKERREVEMTLFTKNKENWTRFKVGVKQIYTIPPKVLLALGEPTKKTTRFYYWEKKGDFLNGRDLD